MTTLTTRRLTLRPPRMSDWPAYRDVSTSSAAAPLGVPLSPQDAWRAFAGLVGHWTLKGFGWFTMADRDGPVGVCGLHHPPPHSELEIGWITFAPAQRKGYAVEAARAARLGATCDGEIAAHTPDCRVWMHAKGAA